MNGVKKRKKRSRSRVLDHRPLELERPNTEAKGRQVLLLAMMVAGQQEHSKYRLRAKLWLHTTNLDPIARGPRMLQALTGKAFEAAKHLIEDDNWCGSPDNGMELIRYLSRPECFGKEELESLWSAMT